MQNDIADDVHTEQSVTPFQSLGKSAAVDKIASGFDNANLRVKKITRLIEHGIYDAEIARYIPGTLDLVFQGMMENIKTIEHPADLLYKDKETLDFELNLDENYYTNLKGLHICFPIRFRKLSNPAQDLDPNLLPINNFFAHWIKEIDITKYGANKSLIPTTTPQEVYRYSDAMLKHLPKNALKMI